MTWLFLYALALSLYDLHTRRIPNWATIPLIAAGFIAHFPASPEIWFASIGLFLAWSQGWMGAGDAKLWIALLWALPIEDSTQALPLMFLTFFFTSLLQLSWRLLRKQPVANRRVAHNSLSALVLVCTLTCSAPCSTARTRAATPSFRRWSMPSVPPRQAKLIFSSQFVNLFM